MRAASCITAAAAVALTCTSVALGGRPVSVGYRTPAALHGLRVLERVPALRTAEVLVRDRRAERALRARPGIRFVQRIVPRTQASEPLVPALAITSVPEWQWSAMHADLVPQWVLQQAAGITIAVVDTGADVAVPNLAAKHPTTYNAVTGSTFVQDLVGHGTFVASLAGGAITDPLGMVGFGGEARLMIVQANRGGTGFTDIDEANGIVWAVDHGAQIVNLSFAGPQTSAVERSAIDYATKRGVLLVAAAGNAAQQGNPVVYPAALIGRHGLVVGASTMSGGRASFSTTGSYVDVLAPGVNVLGALPGGVSTAAFSLAPMPGATGNYGYGTGTSYSAPEVAGAAALVWAVNPKLDAAGVAAVIEASASGSGVWTDDLAYGTVDAAAAVERASSGGAAPQMAPLAPRTKTKPSRTKRGHTRDTAKAVHTTPYGRR